MNRCQNTGIYTEHFSSRLSITQLEVSHKIYTGRNTIQQKQCQKLVESLDHGLRQERHQVHHLQGF